jgi:hypothetical protein
MAGRLEWCVATGEVPRRLDGIEIMDVDDGAPGEASGWS